jgi:hypothetical protein
LDDRGGHVSVPASAFGKLDPAVVTVRSMSLRPEVDEPGAAVAPPRHGGVHVVGPRPAPAGCANSAS